MDILGLVDIPQWILILIGVLTAIYIYYSRKYSVWSNKGVTQIWPCIPLFGNVLRGLRAPMNEIEIDTYKKYGRLYGGYEGTKPVLVVSEPELIRQILVKDFSKFPGRRKMPFKDPFFEDALTNIHGERWKWMRALISRTFSTGKMRKMCPLVSECTKSLIENLREASEKGGPVDCKSLIGASTMDVIARCAFGMKIDSHKDPNNPFVINGKEILNFRVTLKLLLMLIVPKFFDLFGARLIKKETADFFMDISRRLIKERNEKKTERVDFLQLLLDASELKDDPAQVQESENLQETSVFDLNENANSATQIPVSGFQKKALTESEVLSQCCLFFLAGFESTATPLSHALYHLALNPEVQDRLVEEIQNTLKEHGKIEYDTLGKMPYLEAVISETLRMNTPGVRLERLAGEDVLLGDTGIVIPKGAIIAVPALAMHRDGEFFPDPDTFNPDRFMPENKHNIIPYTYLPFGGGPRNCVAMRFALMVVKIFLANMVDQFKFSRCAETKVPLEYSIGDQFLRPKGNVLKVEKRRP